jgi:hypothetical protein
VRGHAAPRPRCCPAATAPSPSAATPSCTPAASLLRQHRRRRGAGEEGIERSGIDAVPEPLVLRAVLLTPVVDGGPRCLPRFCSNTESQTEADADGQRWRRGLVELARDARLERPREKRGSLVPPVGAERLQGVGSLSGPAWQPWYMRLKDKLLELALVFLSTHGPETRYSKNATLITRAYMCMQLSSGTSFIRPHD